MKYRIEAITLPVADVDRAKTFYEQAGWNLDVDTEPTAGMRVVQFTPPGSDCSITFGIGMDQAPPGTYRATYLSCQTSRPPTATSGSAASRSATFITMDRRVRLQAPIPTTATTPRTRSSPTPMATPGSSRRFPAAPARTNPR